MKYSDHPVATGGSPIVTWLPNQLSAVMDLMETICACVDVKNLDAEHAEVFEALSTTAAAQNRVLKREVIALREKYPDTAADAKSSYKA